MKTSSNKKKERKKMKEMKIKKARMVTYLVGQFDMECSIY